MITNRHKQSQTTSKQLQTTSKRPQNTNKRPQTTSKRQQTATLAHQTKRLMFYFFFPNPVITRATRILQNIGSQLGEIASYFHSICAEQEK